MTAMTKKADLVAAPQPTGLCSQPVEGVGRNAEGQQSAVTWQLPEEVPVALQINSTPFTVMMATPADLADFGIGFVLAEGIVKNRSDIRGVLAMPVENGLTVDIAVDESALAAAAMPRRSIEGRSGCGLCGVENIADVVRVTDPVPMSVRPDPAAILKAAAELPRRQPMNRLNHTVHGAAWVTLDGEVGLVREDVGRHNALDKLIGALCNAGTDLASGFVLMTSRCSFELVQKTATVGIGALVTVSAPTLLALEIARKARMYLASLGDRGVVVFNS
jgi:FdhD protein